MCSQGPQKLLGQEPLGLIEGTCFRDLRARCKQGANKRKTEQDAATPACGKCRGWGAGALAVSGPELSWRARWASDEGRPWTPC